MHGGDAADRPLAGMRREHPIEFEIISAPREGSALRFRLTPNHKGTFDLANTRLQSAR